MNYKIDFLFNAGKQGWSETWYKVGGENTHAAIMADADAVAQARIGLLGSGILLEFLRVSSMTILGDSRPLSKPPTFVENTSAQFARGIPEKAWLFRATAGPGGAHYRRQVWTRGMPDEWSNWTKMVDGTPVLTPNYQYPAHLDLKIKAFEAAIKAKVFCLRVLKKDAPVIAINEVAIVNEHYVVTTNGNHGLLPAANDVDLRMRRTKFRIKGATFHGAIAGPTHAAIVNGVHEMVASTPTSITLAAKPNEEVDPPWYLGAGTLQQQVYEYAPVTELIRIKLGKKDVGRAFFVPRGRARKRKCKCP